MPNRGAALVERVCLVVRSRRRGLLLALLAAFGGQFSATLPPLPAEEPATGVTATESAGEQDPLVIFERRIMPIFRSAKPSSCTECHLSGVELKNYISSDPRQSFTGLVNAGLVNLDRPDESKILEFIQRAPENPNLILDKVRGQEYEAFRAWIVASARDPQLAAEARQHARSSDAPSSGPGTPVEVIRHGRRDRVLASFEENVWSEINRCVHCHSPEFNRGHIEKFGKDFVDEITWIVPKDPEATLKLIVENGLIDLDAPEESLLLTKPTMIVEHQGGQKMVAGDRSYEQFLRFSRDYANIVRGAYLTADQLPDPAAEAARLSKIFLRLEGVPENLGRYVLRVELYPWDFSTQSWSAARWATAEWFVNGKARFWQSPLHLTAPRGSARAEELHQLTLPAGRYQVRVLIDRNARLEPGETVRLTNFELLKTLEVESRWRPEFPNKTIVDFE